MVSRIDKKCKQFASSGAGKNAPAGVTGLRVRRALVAAMEQQMWFFGCDAACADGNLLVRFGFERHRRESHRGQSSSYRLLWSPEADQATTAQVDLHGWCAGWHLAGDNARAGGFLYVRSRNRVGWYRAPEPPAPGDYDDLPTGRSAFRVLGHTPEAGFCRVAGSFLGWLEDYETWIGATCGPGYRQRCHARAPLPWLPPAEARGWLVRYRQQISPLANTSVRSHLS